VTLTRLPFLIAHEAGHAKQEEQYGQSCYTAGNVEFSKFDWFRTLADVTGATFQGFKADGGKGGALGAASALAVAQKQACEDNADAWAVRLMRQTRGADPNGGVRLFNKFTEYRWQSLTEQFTAGHSIDLVRIGHVLALIQQR
jgi:predicted Zn-dependent protease